MKPVGGRVHKKMATVAPDQLTDLFGPRSSIPVNTTTPSAIRGISRLRRINIPKKKPTNTKMCSSVDMMEDISSTIKDNQEDNVYECPFCFEKLKAPYPEELEKAIKEVKEKKRTYKEEQKKAYETKVAKERAEGRIYIEPLILKDAISEEDKKMVCNIHKMELEVKPLAKEKGYPETIEFEKVEMRINTFKEDLVDIIMGRTESDWLMEAKRTVEKIGLNKSRDTTELINHFQNALVKRIIRMSPGINVVTDSLVIMV